MAIQSAAAQEKPQSPEERQTQLELLSREEKLEKLVAFSSELAQAEYEQTDLETRHKAEKAASKDKITQLKRSISDLTQVLTVGQITVGVKEVEEEDAEDETEDAAASVDDAELQAELAEMDSEAKEGEEASPSGAPEEMTELPEEWQGLNVTMTSNKIQETSDLFILRGLLKLDARRGVQKALEARLAELEPQPETSPEESPESEELAIEELAIEEVVEEAQAS